MADHRRETRQREGDGVGSRPQIDDSILARLVSGRRFRPFRSEPDCWLRRSRRATRRPWRPSRCRPRRSGPLRRAPTGRTRRTTTTEDIALINLASTRTGPATTPLTRSLYAISYSRVLKKVRKHCPKNGETSHHYGPAAKTRGRCSVSSSPRPPAGNAEIFNPIAQRLKRESPFKATMMATLTNGAARSGYIPDDASYGKYTFEVLSSRLQPGCAESSIVHGLLGLVDGARRADCAVRGLSMRASREIGDAGAGVGVCCSGRSSGRARGHAANSRAGDGRDRMVTEAECTAPSLVATIAPVEIGEPVRSVTLRAAWVAATGTVPAHCRVDGVDGAGRHGRHGAADQLPRDPAGVVERPRGAARRRRHERHHPESDRRRARAAGAVAARARASPPTAATRAIRCRRSGRGAAAPRRPAPNPSDDWALNDEAIAQPRLHADEEDARRRDGAHRAHVRRAAAVQLLHRHLAGRPRGADRRAALSRPTTTASRPTCRSSSFSTLMLAPELIRIHEKPLGQLGDARQGQRHSRRVHAPVRRARRPGRRHHQQLHGVPRDLRRRRRARRNRHPWTAKRCPNNVDPNPADTSASACLTDGQISTLEFVYSRYTFATPLANGVRDVRHVGAQHRSVGQRPDSQRRASRAGRRRRPTRRCTRTSASSA